MLAETYKPSERRPLASRDWKVMQRTANALARRGISANAISLAGMICALIGGTLLAATPYAGSWERAAWLAAAALIQLRLLANLLDGMVAIESGQASAVGELFNEVPDRISDAAILVGLGYAVGGNVPLGLTAACVALFTAYIRAMGKVAGAHQEFCGPMAKQQRMFVVTVLAIFCGLAPTYWQRLDLPTLDAGLPAGALLLIILGGLVTALRRLYRVARVLRSDAL